MRIERPQPPDDEFARWTVAGNAWLRPLGGRRADHLGFLRSLHASGRNWSSDEQALFPARYDDEWLTEILARADNLTGHLRKVPIWPVTFDGGELTIVLTANDDWALAWAGLKSHGVVVSFRPADFEVKHRRHHDAEVAVGLAISWFIDCCIVIEREAPPGVARAATPSIGGGQRAAGVTYVPQAAFRGQINAVQTHRLTIPRAHRVKGHVRKLHPGQTPSTDARSHAPAWVRRQMDEDETFVVAHTRGLEVQNTVLRTHLSKYSALADAIGSAGAI